MLVTNDVFHGNNLWFQRMYVYVGRVSSLWRCRSISLAALNGAHSRKRREWRRQSVSQGIINSMQEKPALIAHGWHRPVRR